MSEHSGNKNPVSSLLDFAKNGFWLMFLAALIFGLITGLKPSQGNIGSVLDWGSLFGSWFNVGGNSIKNTFMKDVKGLETLDGTQQPRLMNPQPQKLNDAIPASAKTQNSDLNSQSNSQTFVYKDLDGDGIITPEEIAKQNK